MLRGLALVGARMGKSVSVAIIRKERKRTGLGRNIEGDLPDGPVILIDDVIHTGRSAEKARAVLAQAGGPIARVFVVVDYPAAAGLAWRQRLSLEVTSPFPPLAIGLQLTHPNRFLPTCALPFT